MLLYTRFDYSSSDVISILIQIICCYRKEIKQILDSFRKKWIHFQKRRIYRDRHVHKALLSIEALKNLKYIAESEYGSKFHYYRQCELHQHLYGKIDTNEEIRKGALLYHAHFQ